MLLTIQTAYQPATDLGYLLHKHPDRLQTFNLTFGKAQVFYPQASAEVCQAALLLELDPVALVRSQKGAGATLSQYVNDRPYVASSFMSVAIAEVFGTAMNGGCRERPELARQAIPLEVTLAALPCRGGEAMLRRIFEPLGYEVTAEGFPLDTTFPEWGESSLYQVTLRGEVRLADLLSHLYVLMPVLDNIKHYWVGKDEVEKLLAKGEGWLSTHPEREFVTKRYLRYSRKLISDAYERLTSDDPVPDEDEALDEAGEEPAAEAPMRLNDERLTTVVEMLRESGCQRVLDLGCGGGKLLRLLLKQKQFTHICGMDVSHQALEVASSRLKLERMSPRQRDRISLLHGSLIYKDERLLDYEGAAVVEVIEHLDPSRLEAFAEILFGYTQPGIVALTTPNRDYNVCFEGMDPGAMRHTDHRFEWTRMEFQGWATAVAEEHGYTVEFYPIGPLDEIHGSPTQMGVFRHET